MANVEHIMDSIIFDVITWTSPIKEINDYLKTHNSIQVAKTFVDEKGAIKQGIFTFEKYNKEILWTLTIDEDQVENTNCLIIKE